MVSAPCVECGFPVAGYLNEQVECPYCGSIGVITQDASSSGILLAAGMCFIFGIVVGKGIS